MSEIKTNFEDPVDFEAVISGLLLLEALIVVGFLINLCRHLLLPDQDIGLIRNLIGFAISFHFILEVMQQVSAFDANEAERHQALADWKAIRRTDRVELDVVWKISSDRRFWLHEEVGSRPILIAIPYKPSAPWCCITQQTYPANFSGTDAEQEAFAWGKEQISRKIA